MGLIFDRFATQKDAEAFAATVPERFPTHQAFVHASHESLHGTAGDEYLRQPEAHDFFPFELTPPIVLVTRTDEYGEEEEIRALVAEFDGEFAGT